MAVEPYVESEPRLPLDVRSQDADPEASAEDASANAPEGAAHLESSLEGAAGADPTRPLPDPSEISPRPMRLAHRHSDAERASSPAEQPERTVANTALLDGRMGLAPLALTAVVFLAVGFAAGYGMASREWPTDPEATPAVSAPAAVLAPEEPKPSPTPASPKPEATPSPIQTAASPRVVPATPKPVPAARAAAPARPVDGQLVVRSTPTGARVLVDGHDSGQTPLTLRELPFGSHAVRVIQDGYVAQERRLAITAELPSQTVTFALVPESATAAAPKPVGGIAASLRIESRPVGANVFFDGRPIGTTPLQIEDVAAGAHMVRLELAGYSLWTATVDVEAGVRQRIAASLDLLEAKD